MRRKALGIISIAIGVALAALAAALILWDGGSPSGSPNREAESRQAEPWEVGLGGNVVYPAELSNLPGPARGLAFDEAGVLWFVAMASEKPTLYGYDPATSTLETFALPGPPQAFFFVATFELGKGPRAGTMLLGWQSELWEVDTSTGRPTQVPFKADPVRRIMDIAADDDGTLWVSRDNYPYLIALRPDGSQREYSLPEGSGSPNQLAIDSDRHVWATLQHHRVVQGADSGNLTLRFDPAAERADVLPWQSWNIAGRGGPVVAVGGQAAGASRLDAGEAQPVPLGAVGMAFPGEAVAVGPDGATWYRSPPAGGIVRVAADGSESVFPLPTYTGNLRDTICNGCPEVETTTLAQVNGIAVAADGSAWFATGNRIGHAIP